MGGDLERDEIAITDGKTTIHIAPARGNQPAWFAISGEVDDGYGNFFPPHSEMVRLRDWLNENVKD